MAEDSRDYPRAQLPAVRARYENAAGATFEAEVLDIGQGGAFIKTEAPLAPGKRLALELIVLGEPRPIPVVARVVWVRAIAASEARPEGMGLKFIDLEDEALGQIGALVHMRERTIQGIGVPGFVPTPEIDPELLAGDPPVDPFIAQASETSNASLRERTLSGGFDETPGPARERTLLGIEAEPGAEATGGIRGRTPEGGARRSQASLSGERERSIPLGLVTKKPHAETFETDDRPSSPSDDTQPSRLRASQFHGAPPRRTGLRWAWAIVVVAGAGGAGYAYRDRLTGFVRAASEPEKASAPSAPPAVDVAEASSEARADAADDGGIGADAATAAPLASASASAASPSVRDAGVANASSDASAAPTDAGKLDAGAHGGAAIVPPSEPAASSSASSGAKKAAAPRPKPKPRPKPEDDNPY